MTTLPFGVGLAIAGLLWAALLADIARPSWRFWPPGERSWKLYANWGLVLAFDVALALVVARTYDTWLVPRAPSFLAVGVLLAVGGAAIAFYSARTFEPEQTMGLPGALRTAGPYARSRNPQYVGMFVALAGIVVLANSRPATVLCLANAGWLALRALAEERFLERRHGDAFRRYRDAVPRFVGRRSLRRDERPGSEQ